MRLEVNLNVLLRPKSGILRKLKPNTYFNCGRT